MDFRLGSARDASREIDSTFRFGIEEEYFLCDQDSLQPAMRTPDALFARHASGPGLSLNREMLQAQLEVATRPHTSCGDARAELAMLRQTAAAAAADHGLRILACGTHPTADWRTSVLSPKQRDRKSVV